MKLASWLGAAGAAGLAAMIVGGENAGKAAILGFFVAVTVAWFSEMVQKVIDRLDHLEAGLHRIERTLNGIDARQ